MLLDHNRPYSRSSRPLFPQLRIGLASHLNKSLLMIGFEFESVECAADKFLDHARRLLVDLF
jgi:hypothetical protein